MSPSPLWRHGIGIPRICFLPRTLLAQTPSRVLCVCVHPPLCSRSPWLLRLHWPRLVWEGLRNRKAPALVTWTIIVLFPSPGCQLPTEQGQDGVGESCPTPRYQLPPHSNPLVSPFPQVFCVSMFSGAHSTVISFYYYYFYVFLKQKPCRNELQH